MVGDGGWCSRWRGPLFSVQCGIQFYVVGCFKCQDLGIRRILSSDILLPRLQLYLLHDLLPPPAHFLF